MWREKKRRRRKRKRRFERRLSESEINYNIDDDAWMLTIVSEPGPIPPKRPQILLAYCAKRLDLIEKRKVQSKRQPERPKTAPRSSCKAADAIDR